MELNNIVDLESTDDVALADKMNAGRKQILDELHHIVLADDALVQLRKDLLAPVVHLVRKCDVVW